MTTDTSRAQPGAHVCERRTEGPHVNGVRIDPVSRPGFLHAVEDFIGCGRATGNAHVIHFCAAHPTVEARHDAEYRALLNRGDLNVADGMPVAWAARRDGRPTLRLAGTDGMGELCAWGETRDLAHYLYGATEETLAAMRANLERTYPEIRIVGVESPPFRAITDEELDETAARIRAAGVDAVWIGLGAPKQDVMAARLRERDARPVAVRGGRRLRLPRGHQEPRAGVDAAQRPGVGPPVGIRAGTAMEAVPGRERGVRGGRRERPDPRPSMSGSAPGDPIRGVPAAAGRACRDG